MADVVDLPTKPRGWFSRITDTILGRSSTVATPGRVNPFVLPEHPPGVVPRGQGMAMDDAGSGLGAGTAFGWAYAQVNSSILAEGLVFLGYPYLSEIAQRPEYRRAVETIAADMTRKFIKLKAKETSRSKKKLDGEPGGGEPDDSGDDGEEENRTERIGRMNDVIARLDMQNVFRRAAEQDGFFGRGHIYLDFSIDDDDTDELRTSIGSGRDDTSRAKIKKGSLRALRTVEAVWCYPTNYNSTNPLRDDWYRPTQWFVMQRQVNATRLITLVGREVPDILKPAYSFGGLALTQMMKPYVDNWLRTRQSVSDITHNFSVLALMTNLSENLQLGGEELFRRAMLFNNTRDNSGLMMLDKESEDLKLVATPLGGLEALQAQAQEHMCSVNAIPLVKYCGIQPAGLNASSEGEIQSWHETIHSYQERLFKKPVGIVLDFIQLSEFGDVDENIVFDFEPLMNLDEKGEADIDLTKAQTDQIRMDTGVISPEEVRRRVAADPDSPYAGLDVEDLPDLRGEEEMGLEPIGGRPNPVEEQDEVQLGGGQ